MSYKIFLFLVSIQIGFGATAAASSAPLVVSAAPTAAASSMPASAATSVESQHSPLEIAAIDILNSAYDLFDSKKFKVMDAAQQSVFVKEFLAVPDDLGKLKLFKIQMEKGFCDGFDYTVNLLKRRGSLLYHHMNVLSCFSRMQLKSAVMPQCVQDSISEIARFNNIPFLLMTNDRRHIRQALIRKSHNSFDSVLSRFFAAVLNFGEDFSETFLYRLDYVNDIFETKVRHKPNGDLFLTEEEAFNYGSQLLYDIICDKRLTVGMKANQKQVYNRALELLAAKILEKRMTINPKTRRIFQSDEEGRRLILEFMGQNIKDFPHIQAYLVEDVREQFNLFCQTFDLLEECALYTIAQTIHSKRLTHTRISEAIKAEFPQIPEADISQQGAFAQEAFVLRRIYDKDGMYKTEAFFRLLNLLMRGDCSVFFPKEIELPDMSIRSVRISFLVEHVERIMREPHTPETMILLCLFIRAWNNLGFGFSAAVLNQAYSLENFSFWSRATDINLKLKDPNFDDLNEVEDMLLPSITSADSSEQQYIEPAYNMLYEVSLRANNLPKMLTYAEILHNLTTHKEKAYWNETVRSLRARLQPSVQNSPENSEDEMEKVARAEALAAEDKRRAEEQHREWIRKNLDLRKQHREAQNTNQEMQTVFRPADLPSIQFDVVRHPNLNADLEQDFFTTCEALKTNYERVIDDLRAGKKPSDSSKYEGITIRVEGKEYSLWHCRLNKEHRVFYYKIGNKVYVIQAFGHDLNQARLPR